MSNKNYVCDHCKQEVKPQLNCIPTYFRKLAGDKLVEVICADCKAKGIKFSKTSNPSSNP